MIEFLRQAWEIEKARAIFYWHHPWWAVFTTVLGVMIYLAILGSYVMVLVFKKWRQQRGRQL